MFSALTLIGSALWCWVLAVLGQKVGKELDASQLAALKMGAGVDLVHLIHAVQQQALWIVATVVVGVLGDGTAG